MASLQAPVVPKALASWKVGAGLAPLERQTNPAWELEFLTEQGEQERAQPLAAGPGRVDAAPPQHGTEGLVGYSNHTAGKRNACVVA